MGQTRLRKILVRYEQIDVGQGNAMDSERCEVNEAFETTYQSAQSGISHNTFERQNEVQMGESSDVVRGAAVRMTR